MKNLLTKLWGRIWNVTVTVTLRIVPQALIAYSANPLALGAGGRKSNRPLYEFAYFPRNARVL